MSQENENKRKATTEMEIVEPTPKKKKDGRLHAKNWFLTYPRTDDSKDTVFERIKTFFKDNLLWLVVSEEKHLDGKEHLHVAISLKKEIKVKPEFFDQFSSKHGNYVTSRDQNAVLKYVVKTGSNLFQF